MLHFDEIERELDAFAIDWKDEKQDFDYKKDLLNRYDAMVCGISRKLGRNLNSNTCNTRLKQVITCSRGTDHIDLPYFKNLGITVDSLPPGINTRTVAEYCVGIMLSARRKLGIFHSMNDDSWYNQRHVEFGEELNESKVGIVGLGKIGRELVAILKPFNTHIYAYDQFENFSDVIYLGLYELFEICDIVSIHLPLNQKTLRLVNYECLRRLRENSIFINTSRAKVVDEGALLKVVKEKHLRIYLDVWSQEPYGAKDLQHAGINITPHIAGTTKESWTRRVKWIIKTLKNCEL